MTLKRTLAFTVVSSLLLCLQAGGAPHPPAAAELQLLQGTWEGGKGDGKITITITGNSLHFHRDTNFWFETTITLPAGKDPKQFHATIKDCPTASSIGQVVRAFFKIEDGTLTLATMGAEETPEAFEAAVENRYELRKVQPQRRNAEASKSKEPETPDNAPAKPIIALPF